DRRVEGGLDGRAQGLDVAPWTAGRAVLAVGCQSLDGPLIGRVTPTHALLGPCAPAARDVLDMRMPAHAAKRCPVVGARAPTARTRDVVIFAVVVAVVAFAQQARWPLMLARITMR